MRLRTVLAGAATSLVLVLAGCGADNPKPAPPETSSASPSPSASPSDVAPTMPAKAKGSGPGAAKAFVKHYLDVLGYAARTGEVNELRSLAGPNCRSCEGVIAKIDRIYASGGHAEGRGYGAQNITSSSGRDKTLVDVTIVAYPQTVFRAGSETPTRSTKSKTPARFRLDRQGNKWVITEWVGT